MICNHAYAPQSLPSAAPVALAPIVGFFSLASGLAEFFVEEIGAW